MLTNTILLVLCIVSYWAGRHRSRYNRLKNSRQIGRLAGQTTDRVVTFDTKIAIQAEVAAQTVDCTNKLLLSMMRR